MDENPTTGIGKGDQKVICLTHHSPINYAGIHPPKYRHSPYAEAFCSDLSYLLEAPVVGWFYGHTHHPYCKRHKGVLVATNPLCGGLFRLHSY